jgi:glycosyltransferase involved in cell wall biosynthesis
MTDTPEINHNSYQKFDRSVSLICWAYNEEALIGDFLEKAAKLMASNVDDYEIILIEDGSTDKTYEIAKSFQTNNNKLKIFQNGKNLNVGFSSRRAIALASKDYLFWQTIDWCYDIPNLGQYLEYLREWDIVQGVRRRPVEVKVRWLKPIVALINIFGIKHITKRSDTIPKAIISVINFILIRILFRVPLSDFQNITFYPTKWIQSIKLEARSSFANPEGLIKSYWSGMNIKEVPIHFIPRKEGVAKGTGIKAIMTSVQDIFQLWFQWVVLGKRGRIQKGKICRVGAIDSI